MELLVIAVLVLVLVRSIYLARIVWRAYTEIGAQQQPPPRREAQRQPARNVASPRAEMSVPVARINPDVRLPDSLIDLRGCVPLRWVGIAGTSFHGGANKIRCHRTKFFLLKLEPENPHDPNAIAVYSGFTIKVGYVPAGIALRLTPALAPFGTWFVAQRNFDDYTAEEIGVPNAAALAKLSERSLVSLDELKNVPDRPLPRAATGGKLAANSREVTPASVRSIKMVDPSMDTELAPLWS